MLTCDVPSDLQNWIPIIIQFLVMIYYIIKPSKSASLLKLSPENSTASANDQPAWSNLKSAFEEFPFFTRSLLINLTTNVQAVCLLPHFWRVLDNTIKRSYCIWPGVREPFWRCLNVCQREKFSYFGQARGRSWEWSQKHWSDWNLGKRRY